MSDIELKLPVTTRSLGDDNGMRLNVGSVRLRYLTSLFRAYNAIEKYLPTWDSFIRLDLCICIGLILCICIVRWLD